VAKRKKKKRPQNRPAPAATEQAAETADKAPSKGAPPSTSGVPAERKARRDMARKERERALRKYQRRQIIRRGLIAGLVVGIVVLIVGFYMQSTKPATSNSEVAALVAKAPAAAKAAGCGPVSNVGPYQPETNDHQHITGTPPNLATYPSVPPASGPHNPVPIHADVYTKPPDVYQMIHGLEHGGVELWYNPDVAKDPGIATLTTFVKKNQDHVAMAPYDYPGNGASSTLPEGKHFALVAWHFVQLCDKVPDIPVVASFMASYRSPTLGGGPYKGEATELGAAM
jgi:hypothetical protein